MSTGLVPRIAFIYRLEVHSCI